MPTKFILTLTGPDRIGVVEEVTRLLLDQGGNVETSRMARLGGEFAVLMLVAMPADRFAGLVSALGVLIEKGYKVTTTPAKGADGEARPGWRPCVIEVQGADHEGIIHEVARHLARQGITIESAESESAPASTSGVPLFSMTARVLVPPGLAGSGWEAGLAEVGGRLNLDVAVFAAE